eukprot:1447832-Amphidinium_carterae.2
MATTSPLLQTCDDEMVVGRRMAAEGVETPAVSDERKASTQSPWCRQRRKHTDTPNTNYYMTVL